MGQGTTRCCLVSDTPSVGLCSPFIFFTNPFPCRASCSFPLSSATVAISQTFRVCLADILASLQVSLTWLDEQYRAHTMGCEMKTFEDTERRFCRERKPGLYMFAVSCFQYIKRSFLPRSTISALPDRSRPKEITLIRPTHTSQRRQTMDFRRSLSFDKSLLTITHPPTVGHPSQSEASEASSHIPAPAKDIL